MSNRRFLLSLCCLLVYTQAISQSLLNKVPSNATLAVRYSGENFTGNVPVKKLDSYQFIRNNLYKMLHIDSLSSFEATGINLQADAYQYVLISDTAISFVSLFQLRDTTQFKNLLQQNMQAEMRPGYQGGYATATLSDGLYAGWNQQWAILSMCSYNARKKYYDYPVEPDTTAAIVDSAMAVTIEPPAAEKVEIITEKPAPKKATPKKTVPGKKKPVAKGKKKPAVKKPAPPKVEVIEEIVEDKVSYEDSVANARREAWYLEQQRYAASVERHTADSLIRLAFTGSAPSISTDESYGKLIDPAAHVSVWLNYDNLMAQYFTLIFRGIGQTLHNGLQPRSFGSNSNDGFRTGLNMYFEKTRMRMEQKMYSPNPQLSQLGKDMYNSRQSAALAGYINPGAVAYMSSSINTEAMANYWYRLMRQYLSSNPFTGEYADIVDVYMDFMEIIIDEKAIGELLPGNMVMVLHSLQPRMVSYTSYEYDENFKETEVKKTRQEIAPDFSIVLETRKEAFMEKLAHLPLKYAEKGKYRYYDRGGYYELAFDSATNPLKALYFIVKNGRAVITSSLEVVNHTLNNTGYPAEDATRQSVLANNFSMRIRTQKIIEQLSPQLGAGLSQKISRYFEENMGDLQMEGGYNNGLMQGTTYMNINGKHSNSLEFFFNMIEDLNNIMEKDKQEREQKVD